MRSLCPICRRPVTYAAPEGLGEPSMPPLCDRCRRERDRQREYEAAERERSEAAAEQLAQLERERSEAAWLKSFPPLYRQTDPVRLPLQEQFRRVMAWQYGPRGLILGGPTGTGKTRTAWLLLQRLHNEGRQIVAFDALGFSHEVSARFGDGSGESWADGVARADVVFLDDLGKAKLTERVESELFGLIERRTANLLPIIATMNATGAGLAAKTTDDRGEPLLRRLREFCEAVSFP